MKAGDFVARNFPGTQTGIDAAVAYCGSSGFVQIGPGLGSLAPTSYATGVSVVRADSTGWSVLGNNALYLRAAYKNLNGVTDPSIYSDQTVSLTSKANDYAQKSMDIVQRFSDSTSATGLSLNAAHFINRYGVDGVGGGDFETGMGVGAYSEGRGNSVVTGSMYGLEAASTMYAGGSIVNAFGTLSTAQITSGSNSKITTARGIQGLARGVGTGAGTITTAIAGDFIAGLQNTSSVTITDMIAGQFQGIKDAGVTGSIANAYGIKVGTINMGTTNNYGIRVLGASGGSSNNYGISVEGGKAFFADSLTSNGGGRISGGLDVGFANTSTTAGTLRLYGGSSGTTAQRILLLRNNTTDMALQANGTAEFLQYNHNLAIGTPAGTTFAVWNGTGGLRLGDGNVATKMLEVAAGGDATIGDTLRVGGVTDLNSTLVQYKGADIASTAALTLGVGNFFTITGTADITSITAVAAGTVVTLVFSGTAATNGIVDGSNLKLAGNLLYTADDTITLLCDGSNYIELARSVN